MTATAAKLGSAPITLDWSNLSAATQGAMTAPVAGPESPTTAMERLRKRFETGEVGFYDAPIKNELSQAAESQALAASLIKSGRFTDALFLGIGGSALGPVALLAALKERAKNPIRLHFMENPDPLDWKATLASLKPETTLVCAVTKSGTTFETLAQLLLALDWLGKDRIKTHLVAITDPAKGDLKRFAAENGIPTLHIAPSVGGRFSVFSPVGLFPAALAGLDVNEFLLGSKQVRDYVEKAPIAKNALFILGEELLRGASKRSVHVCMPYSTRLKLVGAWFVQLWGESLGKNGKGFTPVGAVGAVDQHSILQLLRDGPDDKVTLFITVDRVDDEVKIPKRSWGPGQGSSYPAFRLLEGHTLHELLRIEYQATSLVLTRQNRPNATFQLDRLDEKGLGALLFAFSILTAFTGTLWGINPFDQPGVEEGKVYIRESLTRGAQAIADEIDENSPVNRLRRERSD